MVLCNTIAQILNVDVARGTYSLNHQCFFFWVITCNRCTLFALAFKASVSDAIFRDIMRFDYITWKILKRVNSFHSVHHRFSPNESVNKIVESFEHFIASSSWHTVNENWAILIWLLVVSEKKKQNELYLSDWEIQAKKWNSTCWCLFEPQPLKIDNNSICLNNSLHTFCLIEIATTILGVPFPIRTIS